MKKTLAKTSQSPAKLAPAPALPPDSVVAIVGRINELQAERLAVIDQQKSHKALNGALAEEEAAMLETVDMSSPKGLKRIKDLRARREIVPHKEASLKRQEAEIFSDLAREFQNLRMALLKSINAGKQEVLSAIMEALKPFFFGRPHDLQRAATDLLYQTNYGQSVYRMEAMLRTETFVSGKLTIPLVSHILSIAGEIVVLDTYCPPPGAMHPCSADGFERKELEEITNDPDLQIEIRVQRGLSREAATKAVESRRKHLKDKLENGRFNVEPVPTTK